MGAPEQELLRARPPGSRLRGALPYLLAGAVGLYLAAFLLYPIGLTTAEGFLRDGRPSLYWFQRVLGNEILREDFANTFLLACAATGLSIVLGVPLAVLRARSRFLGQGVLGVGVLVPLILPPFVGALAVRQIFSQYGVLNLLLDQMGVIDMGGIDPPPDWLNRSGFWGVAILQALHLFPIMYLNASAALANVDPALSQAARNLGASPARTFLRITLPLMRPGLFAGGTIVFIWAFTDIGTPLMLQYDRLIPVAVFRELQTATFTPLVFAMVFLLLSSSVVLYVLGKFIFGRGASAGESTKASFAADTRKLGLAGTAGAWALFGGVIGLAVLPHIGVVLTAISRQWSGTILPTDYTFEYLRQVVTEETTYRSILNSLKYASVATGADIIVGSLVAWLVVRGRVRGRSLLDSLSMLPLAVPGLILAAGYVLMTYKGSSLEAIGPHVNPFGILVIAYSIRRLPFVVRSVSAGLEQLPESLEEAARNLGCGPVRTTFRITLPLVAANVVAASVLVFAFAMLEVSDSLILAQQQVHFPITKEIYDQSLSAVPEAANVAAALGVYGMVLLGGTMGLASLLLGRKLGAVFRA